MMVVGMGSVVGWAEKVGHKDTEEAAAGGMGSVEDMGGWVGLGVEEKENGEREGMEVEKEEEWEEGMIIPRG